MPPDEIASRLLALRGATTCEDLLLDLLEAAVRYARLRVDWALMDRRERVALDGTRVIAHEVVIDACNILSRAMAGAGEPTAWREALGHDRKVIGDMACHLHCRLGLAAG